MCSSDLKRQSNEAADSGAMGAAAPTYGSCDLSVAGIRLIATRRHRVRGPSATRHHRVVQKYLLPARFPVLVPLDVTGCTVTLPLDASEWQADRKRLRNSSVALQMSGSPGRIRTCDTLINSQLRYHCATGECCHAPAHSHLLYQNSDRMQGHSSAPYKRAAHIHLR